MASGLAFGWVHTGSSLAVLAFDQTELLFSVPRTAAASLWARDSGPGWGKGSGSFQEIPWGVLSEADFLFLVCGGIDGVDGSWNLLVPKDHRIVASNLV